MQVPAGRVTTPPPPPAVVAAQSASEHSAKVATAQAVDDEVGRRVERDEQVCARWARLAGPGVPGGVERDEQACARWARWAGPGGPDKLSKCVPGGLGQVCQVELSVMSRLLNCAR